MNDDRLLNYMVELRQYPQAIEWRELGRSVKAKRGSAKLVEMADKLQINRASLSRIERGSTTSREQLEKLLSWLGPDANIRMRAGQ